jgi:hypothetical protein
VLAEPADAPRVCAVGLRQTLQQPLGEAFQRGSLRFGRRRHVDERGERLAGGRVDGAVPSYEAKWCRLGNRAMSSTSARIGPAISGPTP